MENQPWGEGSKGRDAGLVQPSGGARPDAPLDQPFPQKACGWAACLVGGLLYQHTHHVIDSMLLPDLKTTPMFAFNNKGTSA